MITLPFIDKCLFCYSLNIFSNLSIISLQSSLFGLLGLSSTPRYLIGKWLCWHSKMRWHPKMFHIMKKVMLSCPKLTKVDFLRFILNPDHVSKQQRIHFSTNSCLMLVVSNNKLSSAYCKLITLTAFDPLSPSRIPAFVIILLSPLTTRTNNKEESGSPWRKSRLHTISLFEPRSIVCGIFEAN